jgi:formate dehydrogenase maturation protein FdhE
MGIRSALGPNLNDCQQRWGIRIERARALQENQRAFAVALGWYHALLKVQREVALASRSVFNGSVSLRKQIDLSFACSKISSILAVAEKQGSDLLRERATSLQAESEIVWVRRFESVLALDKSGQSDVDDFFFRACLQPIAENLQSQMPPDQNYSKDICPACAGLPQLVALRPEGEGANRYLLCSLCLREWLFRRIVCPFCGEEDKEKLPRYSAEQCDYVHVEACDSCGQYLKAVNMTVDGNAVPLIDEAAMAVLDVWAADHGYKKLVPNLAGF